MGLLTVSIWRRFNLKALPAAACIVRGLGTQYLNVSNDKPHSSHVDRVQQGGGGL